MNTCTRAPILLTLYLSKVHMFLKIYKNFLHMMVQLVNLPVETMTNGTCSLMVNVRPSLNKYIYTCHKHLILVYVSPSCVYLIHLSIPSSKDFQCDPSTKRMLS